MKNLKNALPLKSTLKNARENALDSAGGGDIV